MPDTLPLPEKLLEEIPDPETVRGWLARSIRQAALLRGLLRLAERKANHPEWQSKAWKEAVPCKPH